MAKKDQRVIMKQKMKKVKTSKDKKVRRTPIWICK